MTTPTSGARFTTITGGVGSSTPTGQARFTTLTGGTTKELELTKQNFQFCPKCSVKVLFLECSALLGAVEEEREICGQTP